MTCREKYKLDHPNDPEIWDGMCPNDYGYLPIPDYCYADGRAHCEECWDREMLEEKPSIKDSGARREFETGAVRDIQEGKGRCDLLPLDVKFQLLKYKEMCDPEGIGGVFMDIELFKNTGNINFLFNALSDCCIFGDPFTMFLEVSKHFEEGAKKYGEYNWQKGIPTHCYIDSAVRHYLKYLRGDKDEPHNRAFVWNILCCIWTCIHKPELNDYRKDKKNE